MQKSNTPSGGPLADFINQHHANVTGVLEDFDRVRVQASLRPPGDAPDPRPDPQSLKSRPALTPLLKISLKVSDSPKPEFEGWQRRRHGKARAYEESRLRPDRDLHFRPKKM